jgi:1,4-dihydroxy-6-naphthoate synthase
MHLAISPCPNDTFIFDHFIHHGYASEFNQNLHVTLADIEELNQMALTGKPDLIKISYALYPLVKHHYQLLPCGGALGIGVGPLLVTKNKSTFLEKDNPLIAIPGKHTTANFLLQFAFKKWQNRTAVLFSEIENEILVGNCDAGVIIHEGRFTYQQKGLELITDLGAEWETKTGLPIPLGCIIVKRNVAANKIEKLTELIKESISKAWQSYPQLSGFVKSNAQEMDENVMHNHIQLYVNEYSVDIGEKGSEAVAAMLTLL